MPDAILLARLGKPGIVEKKQQLYLLCG